MYAGMMINNTNIIEGMLNNELVFKVNKGLDIVSITGNWTVDGMTFTSDKITHNQSTVQRITFKNAKGVILALGWEMDSEKGYDFGIFSNIDKTAVNTTSSSTNNLTNTKNQPTGTVFYPIIEDNDEHFIELMYRKDTSQSTGADRIIVTLAAINGGNIGVKEYVSYLQNTGSSYIDTEYIPSSNTDFEICLATTGVNYTWQKYMGAENSAKVAPKIYKNGSSDKYSVYLTTGTVNVPYTLNVKSVLKVEGNDVYNDGVLIGTLSRTEGTSTMSYYVFNSHEENTHYCYMKLYYLKFWENGELVREYVPAIDELNRPCLYEKCTKKLFYNIGSGTFAYGKEE